jgi:peptidoglycan/LPS O-acetylase OafA/YrhL
MKKLLVVATAIVLTIGICVWLSSKETTYPIIFAAPATGVMAFFGILAILAETRTEPASDAIMRGAMAGALVIMYMVVVGFGIFTGPGYGGMSPIAQTLMTSFTSIVGIAVAFYFGSSAYVQSHKQKND